MKNKFIIVYLFVAVCFSLHAQNEKLRVAVLDTSTSGATIDEGTRIAIREIISSTFVNTGKYTIVERSMVERVMQEQKFSTSGAVDDSQASLIGRLAGANKVVLSVITLVGDRNMLSIKLVDVNTASVEKQKIQVIKTNEVLIVVEPMTMELMNEEATLNQQTPISTNTNTKQTISNQTAITWDRQLQPIIVNAVLDLMNKKLGSKANRYKTDEERFIKVGSGEEKRIKDILKNNAKISMNPPAIENGQIIFFCSGYTGKGEDDLVFLFIDGKLIAVTNVLNGFTVAVPDDESAHLITVWRNSSKIYSALANFSQNKKYVFVGIEKKIHLEEDVIFDQQTKISANTQQATQDQPIQIFDRQLRQTVQGVLDWINDKLGSKKDRYKTDEERFVATGAGWNAKVKDLIKVNKKISMNPPQIESNQILFFCSGSTGNREDDQIFLFIDGKMFVATTVLNGFEAIIPDDGSAHLITVWRSYSKIYSSLANFPKNKKYIFEWSGKKKESIIIINDTQ